MNNLYLLTRPITLLLHFNVVRYGLLAMSAYERTLII